MITQLQLQLDPRTAFTPMLLHAAVSTHLNVDANRLRDVVITRRSIDARQRKIKILLTLNVYIDEAAPESPIATPVNYSPVVPDAPECIIVGAGPAGLFAALELIELGIKPIVLERGKDVDSRRLDMARLAREGEVDPDSNYCFGEGGAGAYSDGKLYTRSKKRGPVDKVLNIFHQHGAQPEILIDAHPHIGTDRLPEVIKAMRNTIISCGGEVRFQSRVNALTVRDGKVTGVQCNGQNFEGPVILATGHSARDVYSFLLNAGVELKAKGIAVGVRLEHPQHLIDSILYHNPSGRGKYLPPAEYSMLTRVDGRAVYSFCMCPGGVIIPAASAPGQMVVNGMSPSNRGTRWANSGMVVEILPEDVEDIHQAGELKMMKFQEDIEHAFLAESGGSQNAPAQRMTDFVAGKASKSLPDTSYAPGIHPSRLDQLLPSPIASRLAKAFEEFGRKHRGFLTSEAVLIGDETRTSSPVRVTRDNVTLQSVSIEGLYPCGEGAGYAGGIVSAAIDGINCARAVADKFKSGLS